MFMFGQYGLAVVLVLATTTVVTMITAMGRGPNGKGMVSLYIAAFASVFTGAAQRIAGYHFTNGMGLEASIPVVAGTIGLISAYKLAKDSHDVAGACIGFVCVVMISQATSTIF